jgi:HlyD family secretion protein
MASPPKKNAWLKRLPWIAFLLVVGGGAFAYWRYVTLHPPPPITYKTVAIERRKIVGRVTASGTLQAVVTVQVGSQVSGRLQKINVDFNSQVKKGELLAKIDPQLFQANVAQAHANYVSAVAGVVQAEAKSRDAERVYKRTAALNQQNLASQADVETAETSFSVAKSGIDVAKAALEQAKAQLNQNEVNLSYTNIFSPIDGVVISRSVDVGQTVAASLQAPVLFTIAEDLRKMQVNTNVAEGDVGRLASGMPTYFTVDAFPGQRFNGKISQIRNAAQTLQNVVTYDAVVDVDNSDLRLRPGMTANVTVIYDSRDAVLAVPNAAMRFKPPPAMLGSANATASGSGAPSAAPANARPPRGERNTDTRTVWVLQGDSAHSATLKLGLTDGTLTEVLSGDVKEGDLVVTDATAAGGTPAPAAAAPVRAGRMF